MVCISTYFIHTGRITILFLNYLPEIIDCFITDSSTAYVIGKLYDDVIINITGFIFAVKMF